MNITAIVPAFNEEKTIGSVLEILVKSSLFSEVIVVDDGSSDHTAQVAETHGAHVIRQKNQGKGAALGSGAQAAKSEILFFCDADLTGLTEQHIRSLIDPVFKGYAALAVGLRDRGRVLGWWMEHVLPLIGGERAIIRDVFLKVMESGIRDFGIELAMNEYCRTHKLGIKKVRMSGVGQVVKEKKYGMVQGFIRRLGMITQVMHAGVRLFFKKND
ncbi:glycosyltransferase family 2 protein [Candidatus Uhrbacteria bacterium]|nr:glycosyltransferase family 2 protein [Candidatus Uhrbacteria bacterium]